MLVPFSYTSSFPFVNALLQEIRKQLVRYLGQLSVTIVSSDQNTEPIRKSIVASFFLQAAVRLDDGQYRTLLGNKVVQLFTQ